MKTQIDCQELSKNLSKVEWETVWLANEVSIQTRDKGRVKCKLIYTMMGTEMGEIIQGRNTGISPMKRAHSAVFLRQDSSY